MATSASPPQPAAGQLWAPKDQRTADRVARVENGGRPGRVRVTYLRTGRTGEMFADSLRRTYRPVTGEHARACTTCRHPGPACPGAEGICEGRGPA